MRQLHPEAIATIQSKALFSKAEEQLLSKVGSVRLRAGQGASRPTRETTWLPRHLAPTAASGSGLRGVQGKLEMATSDVLPVLQTSQPTLETFQDLLHRHPDAFYLARTAKALQAHWQLMKQYYLLEDQTGTCPRAGGVKSLSTGPAGTLPQPPMGVRMVLSARVARRAPNSGQKALELPVATCLSCFAFVAV